MSFQDTLKQAMEHKRNVAEKICQRNLHCSQQLSRGWRCSQRRKMQLMDQLYPLPCRKTKICREAGPFSFLQCSPLSHASSQDLSKWDVIKVVKSCSSIMMFKLPGTLWCWCISMQKLANGTEATSVHPFIHLCFQTEHVAESILPPTLPLGCRKEFPFLKKGVWEH